MGINKEKENILKILYITRTFPPQIGGMQNFSYGLYKELSKQADIHLIANKGTNKIEFFLFIFYSFFVGWRFDIVYCNDMLTCFLAIPFKLLYGKRIITTTYGLDIMYTYGNYNGLLQNVKKSIYKKIINFTKVFIDKYLPISKATAELGENFGINNYSIITPGIDLCKQTITLDFKKINQNDLRSEYNIAKDKKILLFLGRLIQRKGALWFLMNVFPRIKNKYHLIIAGDGKELKEILNFVRENNFEKFVTITGKVTNKWREKLFIGSEVFIMPNINVEGDFEGFGIVAIEASMYGTPVLAARMEGIISAVTDGTTGFLYNPEDVSDCINKLNQISQTNFAPSKLSTFTKLNFSNKKLASEYLKEFESIIRKNKKNKIGIKILSLSFYLLVFFFFFNYFNKIDFSKLLKIKINYYYIFLAIFINLASRFYNSFIWIKILHYLGAKNLPYLPLNYVFSKASLGRYVPGKVTWIAGRVFFAMKYGIPKRKLAVSSVFEGALTVLLGFLVGGIFLFFTDSINVIDQKLRIFFLFIIISTAFGLLPPVFNFFLRKAYRFLKKNELQNEDQISAKILLNTSILFIFRLILDGISAFIMILAISPGLSFKSMPLIIGTVNIAGSAGIASLFAPSGLGVREGIEILLLGGVLPKEIILAVVVLMRVLLTVIDIFYFFFSFGLVKIKK